MTAPIERITAGTPPAERAGHEFRYRLAAGYIEPDDVVLDAGCGVGYGAELVPAGEWVGVDIAPDVVDPSYAGHGRWITADLCEWVPDFDFTVGLCFEAIEHVADPQKVIDLLCRARRLVVCSVPIVPTVGSNPFHLHDFDMWSLPLAFADRGWGLLQCVLQPGEMSAVFLFQPDG